MKSSMKSESRAIKRTMETFFYEIINEERESRYKTNNGNLFMKSSMKSESRAIKRTMETFL